MLTGPCLVPPLGLQVWKHGYVPELHLYFVWTEQFQRTEKIPNLLWNFCDLSHVYLNVKYCCSQFPSKVLAQVPLFESVTNTPSTAYVYGGGHIFFFYRLQHSRPLISNFILASLRNRKPVVRSREQTTVVKQPPRVEDPSRTNTCLQICEPICNLSAICAFP